MDQAELKTNISWTTVTVQEREVPRLNITIMGKPSMSEIASLMKQINVESTAMKKPYISVTDLSKMEISNFFRSIILYGMEKAYKLFFTVKHRAEISFVILGNDETEQRLIKDSLATINDSDDDHSQMYRYYFISDESEILPAAEKLLKK